MKRRNPVSTFDAEAARELELYVENDGDLYRQMVKPIQKNLARKMVGGTYRPIAAEKAWLYLIDAGAKKYTREFGTPDAHIFSAATRRFVAARFARHFESEVKSGEIDVGKESGLAKFRKNPTRKSMAEFIRENKEEIDAGIRRALRRPDARLNDAERRQWINNDEGLYNWARSEGVRI